MSPGNVNTSCTMTERLACSDSNAEQLEAVLERLIMIDGFLVAYISILSISAQYLEPKSVLL